MVWNRKGGFPTHTISANRIAVQPDGRIALAGRDCVRDRAAPRAIDPAEYNGSCIDGYVAMLDASGELLWDLHIGTSDGVDDASDLALAPSGGLYVAGSFQAPLVVPDLQPTVAFGGVDDYLLALDADGHGRWARSFGGPLHEGDGPRLSASPSGDVGVIGNLQLGASAGFVARLDRDGNERWRRPLPEHAFGAPAWRDDEVLLAAASSLISFDATGNVTSHAISGGTSASDLAVTERDRVLLYTPGAALSDIAHDGSELRRCRCPPSHCRGSTAACAPGQMVRWRSREPRWRPPSSMPWVCPPS